MHSGPKLCARSVRCPHASTGWGGFQRLSPIGGAANGIPL